MPYLISREQAVARVTRERGADCLICELRERADESGLLLHRDGYTTVLLSRYPRQWGHILVLLDQHCTRFAELPPGVWSAVSAASHRAARMLERALQPARCYIASLGSAREDLPMSSPHLHMHVIPIADADARPAEIFSWQRGVYDAPPDEWRALRELLLDHW